MATKTHHSHEHAPWIVATAPQYTCAQRVIHEGGRLPRALRHVTYVALPTAPIVNETPSTRRRALFYGDALRFVRVGCARSKREITAGTLNVSQHTSPKQVMGALSYLARAMTRGQMRVLYLTKIR